MTEGIFLERFINISQHQPAAQGKWRSSQQFPEMCRRIAYGIHHRQHANHNGRKHKEAGKRG